MMILIHRKLKFIFQDFIWNRACEYFLCRIGYVWNIIQTKIFYVISILLFIFVILFQFCLYKRVSIFQIKLCYRKRIRLKKRYQLKQEKVKIYIKRYCNCFDQFLIIKVSSLFRHDPTLNNKNFYLKKVTVTVTVKFYFRLFVRTSYKRELNFCCHWYIYLPLSIYLNSFLILTFTPETRLTNSVTLWNRYIS